MVQRWIKFVRSREVGLEGLLMLSYVADDDKIAEDGDRS